MGVQAREDLLRGGERAIAAADWETARACLERALEEGDSPDALTGLSKVAMIEREYERAIEYRERDRSARRVQASAPRKAAMCARRSEVSRLSSCPALVSALLRSGGAPQKLE